LTAPIVNTLWHTEVNANTWSNIQLKINESLNLNRFQFNSNLNITPLALETQAVYIAFTKLYFNSQMTCHHPIHDNIKTCTQTGKPILRQYQKKLEQVCLNYI